MEKLYCVGLYKWWSLDKLNATVRFIECQQGDSQIPTSFKYRNVVAVNGGLLAFPLSDLVLPLAPAPQRTPCLHSFIPLRYPLSLARATGGHRTLLPVVDRVVGPGCNEVNWAGVHAALGHRSMKSMRCKRGRGTIDDHQTRRFISHLRNTEV